MFTDLSKITLPKENDSDASLAEQMFRVRYHYAVNAAHGMERLAFRVLPYSLIRSFALTFDPTEPFRLGNKRIATLSRTRTASRGALPQRYYISTNTQENWAQAPNTSTCEYADGGTYLTTFSSSQVALTAQPTHKWRSKDTTRRLRGIGQDMGELELFKYTLVAPNRQVTRTRDARDCSTNDSCHLPALGYGKQSQHRRTYGGAAYISDANITSLRDKAITATNQVLTDKLSGLIAATLPTARRYTLARNVFELKDLPRSVISLRETLRDLSQSISTLPSSVQRAIYLAQSPKHIPGEYLSFWFGWVTTFKAVKDLIEAPSKIAKEVNFLISRRGIPTTLRRTQKYKDGVLTSPGWTYQPSTFSGTLWTETALTPETVSTFETEIRLVINCIFDFPGVGVPQIRSSLLDRKWGVAPTASDVYQVIPWTWLFDWFTGLGNYVDAIDIVNTDKNTINWGIVSAVSRGKHRTTHRTYYDNLQSYAFRHNGGTINTTTQLTRVNTTTESIVDWTVHIRKGVPDGFGLRQTLKPSTMSTYQGSIISALLAQRTGKARYL